MQEKDTKIKQLISQIDELKDKQLQESRETDLKLRQEESKLKQLKTKVQHLESFVQQKDKELVEWRTKWEKRDLLDDKCTI